MAVLLLIAPWKYDLLTSRQCTPVSKNDAILNAPQEKHIICLETAMFRWELQMEQIPIPLREIWFCFAFSLTCMIPSHFVVPLQPTGLLSQTRELLGCSHLGDNCCACVLDPTDQVPQHTTFLWNTLNANKKKTHTYKPTRHILHNINARPRRTPKKYSKTSLIRTNWEWDLIQISESTNYISDTEKMFMEVITWTSRVF
jgi:hypothetical protein